MSAGFMIIGYICLLILVLIAFFAIIIGAHYLSWFHMRTCKHCSHHLEYKGLKEDKGEGHYLFHCPHCGAWEQIPKEEFFREDSNCKPIKV